MDSGLFAVDLGLQVLVLYSLSVKRGFQIPIVSEISGFLYRVYRAGPSCSKVDKSLSSG